MFVWFEFELLMIKKSKDIFIFLFGVIILWKVIGFFNWMIIIFLVRLWIIFVWGIVIFGKFLFKNFIFRLVGNDFLCVIKVLW